MLAMMLATIGAPEAAGYIETARVVRSADGDALDAAVHAAAKNWEAAVAALERAFAAWHSEPWSEAQMVRRALDLASKVMLEAEDNALAERIYLAVREPFAVYALESSRITLAVAAASASGRDSAAKVQGILERLEPNPVWTKELLELRVKTYRATKHPLLAAALEDCRDLIKHEVPEFREGLRLAAAKPTTVSERIDPSPRSGVEAAMTSTAASARYEGPPPLSASAIAAEADGR
jgi:hypothetical protein